MNPKAIDAQERDLERERFVDLDNPSPLRNGYFTIKSPKGGHRTLRVRSHRKGKHEGKRTVELLVGSDNTGDYQPFAYVVHDDVGKGVAVWKKFRSRATLRRGLINATPGREEFVRLSSHQQFAVMLWSLATEDAGQFEQMGYELLASERCYVCNRKLTDPVSIETGIGPKCAGRE